MRVRAYYSKTYTTAHEAAAVSKFRIPEFALRRQLDLTPELFEGGKKLSCFYITSREICIGSETFLHSAS